MSRLTGFDAYGLMEAYNAVYAPQELTEEQVWEEVELWVNSLVEEGYDLSEYTWEDMYEEYLSEIPTSTQMGGKPAPAAKPQAPVMTAFRAGGGNARVRELMRQGIGGVEANRRVSTTGEYLQRQRAQASTRPTPGAGTASSRYNIQNLGPAQYAAFKSGGGLAAMERKGQTAGQVVAQGRANIGRFDGGPRQGNPNIVGSPVVGQRKPPAIPAAPARPAVTSTPKPTTTASAPAPKPQLGPTGKPLVGGIERRTPTSAELRQAQQFRTTGANLTGTGALATRPAIPAPAPAAATTPAPAPVATAPKPNLQQSIRNRRLNMDLDLFDIVQGYLIDEGYAETEEAAAVIMANMSEEWKESILESGYFPTKESQMKDEAKHNLRGQAVKPRTAQTQSPKPSR